MLLDARPLVEEKIIFLKNMVQALDIKAKLVIVRVDGDQASAKYVNNKIKLCQEVGIESEIVLLPSSVSNSHVEEVIKDLNKDKKVTAILLQLPLPPQLDEKYLTELINPKKDADGFTSENLGKLMQGNSKNPIACTPSGIMELLSYYGVQLEGKNVVIINRSNIVGKPLALLMLEKNATVTIAHSRTKDLKKLTREADIVVTAIGKPKFFKAEDFKKDWTVVIDVSINLDENGKLCGDVDKADYEKINAISPVPNGVGRMTVLSLIEQTIKMFVRN